MNLAPPLRTAAFFDLDGTLVPFPTLERRLISALLYRHAIPASNFAWWTIAFARLMVRGLTQARQANKMHFRSIPAERSALLAHQLTSSPNFLFFPEALERVAWHASQGHCIALITGAPQFLARSAAFSLEAQLAQQGLAIAVLVRATVLEGAAGRWTGRVSGQPIVGTAKATAVDSLASRFDLDLRRCYGYGNSIQDRHMLERLGHPIAVNPSKSLRSFAIRRGWEVVDWEVPGQQAGPKFPFLKTKVETLG